MELKEGMYVRSYGKVTKVIKIVRQSSLYEDSGIYVEKYGKFLMGSKLIDEVPHSFNKIDLIEAGDYVNGYLVTKISKDAYGNKMVFVGQRLSEESGFYKTYYDEDIKTVLTKEQFDSESYKVGE